MLRTTLVRPAALRAPLRATVALAAAACALALGGAAQATELQSDPEREEDYVRVVQRQPFTRGGRFAVAPTIALNTNDPLIQLVTAGAQLTYFPRDWIGISAGFHYAFDSNRGARNGLLDQQLRPDLNPMRWSANLVAEWVPIYGKFAVFNRGIMHWDAYLVAGGAAVSTERGGVTVGGVIGVGSRLFVTGWMSVFVEVRDILYNESFNDQSGVARSNFINNLMFGAGVSFFFPSRVS